MNLKKDLRFSGQIQAAAISAVANMAEGLIRKSDKEFIQFLFVAMSSAAEVQGHLYVAADLGYIDKKQFADEQARKVAMNDIRFSQVLAQVSLDRLGLILPTEQTTIS